MGGPPHRFERQPGTRLVRLGQDRRRPQGSGYLDISSGLWYFQPQFQSRPLEPMEASFSEKPLDIRFCLSRATSFRYVKKKSLAVARFGGIIQKVQENILMVSSNDYGPKKVQNLKPLKQEVCWAVDRLVEPLIDLSRQIHKTPELSFTEHKAVSLISGMMQAAGFELVHNLTDLETAFRAIHPARSPGPTVAFLAEYDALPGLGHACGHNIIAATAVGATLAVGALKERLPGTLQLIGCPAEEKGGGKIIMVERGGFKDIDVAMMIHPGSKNAGTEKSLTLDPLEITFKGKGSHASASPELGVKALSAIIQTFNGINTQREHLIPGASIHGIITQGGERTNVVPELAQCRFSIRAPSVVHRDELVTKLKNCAKGAALATGCKVKFGYFDLAYEPMRINSPLEHAFLANLEWLGLEISRTIKQGRGSIDVANVSQVIPTLRGSVAIVPQEIKFHTAEFAEAAFSDTGMQAMIHGAKALAMTAVDVLWSEELQNQIKQCFETPGGGVR